MESLSREEALEVLENAPVAHLGMIDGDEPYVTPMSFVVEGERIFFRTMAGRKLDALRERPSVCIEASRYDEQTGDWESVIIRGEAHETDEDAIKQDVVAKLLRKYESVLGSPLGGRGMRPLQDLPHVVVVDIEDVSGMTSGRGWSERTRPGRL
jgi:nitroimidazol reductase NimA-like FMN-containing flavoprotein (pyridoxamine 5'-phosphate oxidase superfamily)